MLPSNEDGSSSLLSCPVEVIGKEKIKINGIAVSNVCCGDVEVAKNEAIIWFMVH